MSVIKKPLFILGNPRSGTTLLRLIINAHPQICVPPECGFLLWWFDKYKDWTISDTKNSAALHAYIDDLSSSKKIETWGLDFSELEKYISLCAPSNYAELSSTVYHFYSKINNREITLWGDKNNYYIKHIDQLKNIYPDASYIHIVRDGRDVACSYRELMKRDIKSAHAPNLPFEIEDIAKEWSENVLTVSSMAAEQGVRIITVRYEDLVSNTEHAAERLCEFIGLEYSSDMLNYNLAEKDSARRTEPEEFFKWKEKVLRPPTQESVSRYKEDLTEMEIERFNFVAGQAINQYGYVQ